MAVASACFKWVDVLEGQFDKSWVELDFLLMQLEEDEDFAFLHTQSRRHASSLASCFSQLAHKSTVVFQNNAKLEAELMHLREEVTSAKTSLEKLTTEKDYLTTVLQSTLADNHKLKDKSEDIPTQSEDSISDDIKEKTLEEPTSISSEKSIERRCSLKESETCSRLLNENKRLRAELLELESEMIGARLDNVYLDKELAGRIQQIQLLLASNTPTDTKEKMWGQIESEMCLQRSKTIAQMCKTKQEVKSRMKDEISEPNKVIGNGSAVKPVAPGENMHIRFDSMEESDVSDRNGKQIMILKNPADDLGMAILGGKEHNLPIIISEIFPDSAVSRAPRVKAGDIILTVNGEDFTKFSHTEAVNFLSSLRGQIIMDLKSAEKCSEDDPSNLDYRFYKIFDSAVTKEEFDVFDSSSTTGLSHPGKAISIDLENVVNVGHGDIQEMPSVHSSPRRKKMAS
eukprot:TRINITY_DN24716_c0_g1_i1.p1 TRINITY_DN24716_c0_g1~~TRINITY_DN24716_c0_g1_i1.p1  ORF type:complete len:457 (-),score=128.48 TRINITY_DN24716_c0_g1_i1:380-1750(-)